MGADKIRKAGAPSQSVIYFQLLINRLNMPAYAPMLEGLANPDNEAVSHSAISSTNLWASWGAVMNRLNMPAYAPMLEGTYYIMPA